jgi:hypothetical protein
MREQFLVERTPISADAHRFVVLDRGFNDRAELAILLFLETDIAGIDAIFVERFGTGGMIGKQLVADVMEVADNRHVHIHLAQLVLDVRNGSRRFVAINRNADDLGSGPRQRGYLLRRAVGVSRVGVGHRLHHDGCAAADGDVADFDSDGLMPFCGAGKFHHEISALSKERRRSRLSRGLSSTTI